MATTTVSANTIHIYAAKSQPMTRFNVGGMIDDKSHFIRYNKRHQFFCGECGKKRYAKNLRVQVYYDKIHAFCADGCKRSKAKG